MDLRRDVVTLRDAFERALEKKKKYIGGLLNELEEGEEQYSMAFRAQMENIERMMRVWDESGGCYAIQLVGTMTEASPKGSG